MGRVVSVIRRERTAAGVPEKQQKENFKEGGDPMEKLEVILSVAGTIAGLGVTALTFLVKFIKGQPVCHRERLCV